MNDYKLQGKRALITGGTHGIGLAIARKLVSNGVSVAILARNETQLSKVSKELSREGIEIICLECDVLSELQVIEAWNKLLIQWPGVDILINNVGGGGRWGSDDILATPDNVWNEVFRKNAGVATQLTKLAIPHMKNQSWGRVIAVTSIFGEIIGGRPWFNVAKVAQTTFIKNLSRKRDLVRCGITFNAVAPGSIFIEDTGWDEMRKNQHQAYEAFLEQLPLGRLGTPEEVASLVLYLCSEESSYINGASITIDGGESIQLA